MAYEFTAQMDTVSNMLWAVTSAVGAGLCFIVLLIIAVVWFHPKSRVHLDRVSFRIVVYALCTNMIFGIASAVGGLLTGPGFLCGFSIFILQLTLQFSSFLLFSIALNLQLVVVHQVNGQKMEKFYLIGSALMSVILVVPPYAAGQYGWDPLEQDCWYTNDNQVQRIIWQVTTQMGWTALTVIGEVICATTVMVFMFKHNVRIRRVFYSSRSFSQAASHAAPQVIHVNNYKQIILRIALYPIASCCVNLLSIFTALHSTISGGIHNPTDYHILLLSDSLYGGRAIVYALLAVSDPALVRGIKTLISHLFYSSQAQSSRNTSKQTTSESYPNPPTSTDAMIVHIELSTIQPSPSDRDHPLGNDKSDKDLNNVSEIEVHKSSIDHDRFDTEGGREIGSQTLAGVEARDVSHIDFSGRREKQRQDQEAAFKRQI